MGNIQAPNPKDQTNHKFQMTNPKQAVYLPVWDFDIGFLEFIWSLEIVIWDSAFQSIPH
jgi:hypothetical protein